MRVPADLVGPAPAPPDRRRRLAARSAATGGDLLEGRVAEHPSRLVAEVASRRRYGRVLAENPPGLGFLPGERRLLEAHARLAAAALDAAAALEDANGRWWPR